MDFSSLYSQSHRFRLVGLKESRSVGKTLPSCEDPTPHNGSPTVWGNSSSTFELITPSQTCSLAEGFRTTFNNQQTPKDHGAQSIRSGC